MPIRNRRPNVVPLGHPRYRPHNDGLQWPISVSPPISIARIHTSQSTILIVALSSIHSRAKGITDNHTIYLANTPSDRLSCKYVHVAPHKISQKKIFRQLQDSNLCGRTHCITRLLTTWSTLGTLQKSADIRVQRLNHSAKLT